MDAQAAAGGRRVHGAFDVAAADEDSAPGILQLLVRWGLPAKAANILTEQELASERTAKKLLAALQVQRPTQSSPSVTGPNVTPTHGWLMSCRWRGTMMTWHTDDVAGGARAWR